jgi:protein SCO1/2
MRRNPLPLLLLYAALVTAVFGTFAGFTASAEAFEVPAMPNERLTLGKEVGDVRLVDSNGKEFSLRSYIDGKPLIISLIYTKCITACLLITDGFVDVVEKMGGLGADFKALTLSFDPDDTSERLSKYSQTWRLDRDGWIVAGGDKNEVAKLLTSLDFHYVFDSASGEFMHPNYLVLLTPGGKVSKYIYGVSYDAKTLKLSLLEAKKESSSLSVAEGFLLRCYKYDPITGTYSADWYFILEVISGLVFFTSMFLFLFARKIYLVVRKIF